MDTIWNYLIIGLAVLLVSLSALIVYASCVVDKDASAAGVQQGEGRQE